MGAFGSKQSREHSTDTLGGLLAPGLASAAEDLDAAADGEGPAGLTRTAYARKVFVSIKSGYLNKKSSLTPGTKSGIGKIKFMNYVSKKRFFVLTGASLMYHHDHKNLDDTLNSKEIVLDEDSRVLLCDMPNSNFGIELIADGKVTQMGARDEREREEWRDAIESVIRKLKGRTRGYLLKLRAGVPTPSPLPLSTAPLAAAVTSGDFNHVPKHFVPDTLLEGKGGAGEWTRKYFVIDDGTLTFHASHSSIVVVQGAFKLPPTTQVEVRQGLLLVVRNGTEELVCRAAEEGDLTFWEDAIKKAVKDNTRKRAAMMDKARGDNSLTTVDDFDSFLERASATGTSWAASNGGGGGEEQQGAMNTTTINTKGFDSTAGSVVGGEGGGGGGALLKGDLMTRPDDERDVPWKAAHYVLEKGRILVYEDRHHVKPKQIHKISPSCSVFETNLKAYSFEVVVAGRVLHLQGSSFEDNLRWIATLKAAINNSPPDDTDPLLVEALKLEDTFYYADFETKQPLGVVLERSKEWAIVKLANAQLSQVTVGSALASVNGESVALRSYEETINMLTGWKPPLNLIFRRAPVREGWLKKASDSGKGKARKWKNVWADLREGKLSWYKLGPGGTLLGAIPMIGSAVALVPTSEAGAPHCLSVVAGVTSVTLQALSQKDNLSWASHLYQASAVANGGGYLLDQERDQQLAYEDQRRRRLDQEASERDRFLRNKKGNPQQQQEQQPQEQKQLADAQKTTITLVASGSTVISEGESVAPHPSNVTEEAREEAPAAPAAPAPAPPTVASHAIEGDVEESSHPESAVAASAGDGEVSSFADGASDGDIGDETSGVGASEDVRVSERNDSAATFSNDQSVLPLVVETGPLDVSVAGENHGGAGESGVEERDVDGGHNSSSSTGSDQGDRPRQKLESKTSSVMDLIRKREAAAKAAAVPESARQKGQPEENAAALSPSFAAVRQRSKVDTRAWGGKSGGGGSTSDSDDAVADRGASPSVPAGEALSDTGGVEEDADGVKASTTATATALSPGMAAARTRKQVDKSAWSGGASGGGGASAVAKASSPSASDFSVSRQSSHDQPSRQRTHDTASATPVQGQPATGSVQGMAARFSATAPMPVTSNNSNNNGGSEDKSLRRVASMLQDQKQQPQQPSQVNTKSIAARYARAASASNSSTSTTSTGGKTGKFSNNNSSKASGATTGSSASRQAAAARPGGGGVDVNPADAGGSSVSPVSTPGAGGAAATGSAARKQEITTSTSVKAISGKLFAASNGSATAAARPPSGTANSRAKAGGLRATSGVRSSTCVKVPIRGSGVGKAAAAAASVQPSAAVLARGPIGGPWDEEEVLKWVRNVTKMDIDPECGVAYSLKDGIALCRLMSKLQPGAAMSAASESSLAYKQMANICIFLRSCRTLGLGESILFETSDLYEEKDIPGVVKTLVALGESVPQTCPNFKGPRLDMRKFAWSTTTLPTASQASSSTASRKGGFSSMAGGARGGARSAGAMSGTGNGVSSTIRNSNGNLRNSNSSVGAGTSTGGGGVFSGRANGGMWQRGMGNEQPAMSGGDDSSEEEEDEVDDDDYYDQEEDADDVITSAMVRGNSAIADGSGLTDEVLAKAFDSVEKASQSGGLSPLQFSALWRSLSGGQQNLFAEMKIFHKFNVSGNSVVDLEEFKNGFRLLASDESKEYERVLNNLHQWAESQPAAF